VSPHNRADIKVTSSFTIPNIVVLQLVTWPRLILPRRASLQLSSGYQACVDDPRHAYYPIGNWLGDVPSSHQRHRNHRHLPRSILHSLTKLIARDKAVSTFWIILANHLKRSSLICSMAVARKGSSLVYLLWKPFFSCWYSMSKNMFYDISISLLKYFIKHF
jgi:hypothetical protein